MNELETLYAVSKTYYEAHIDAVRTLKDKVCDEVYEFNNVMMAGAYIRDMQSQKRFENIKFIQEANLVYVMVK
jgi:hypothetical protein